MSTGLIVARHTIMVQADWAIQLCNLVVHHNADADAGLRVNDAGSLMLQPAASYCRGSLISNSSKTAASAHCTWHSTDVSSLLNHQ